MHTSSAVITAATDSRKAADGFVTAVADLLDLRYAGSIAAPAAGGTSAAPAVSIPKAVAGAKYVRPNGEEYIPRRMTIAGTVTEDVAMVRRAREANLGVLLYGVPGTGKTALVEAAFPDVITMQGTNETETADFIGSWVQQPDGTYLWVDGPLVVAFETGVPLFIDEIALIDPRSLACVYSAMDGRNEINVTANPMRGVITGKDGFYVAGAYNPDAPGAILSDALISRFPIPIEMTTDWSLAAKLDIPAPIIQVTRNLNLKYRNGEMTAAPQLREMIAFRNVTAVFGQEFALANYLGAIRPENRDMAVEAVKAVFGTAPAPLSL